MQMRRLLRCGKSYKQHKTRRYKPRQLRNAQVRHFQVLHFQPLRFGPSFSGLAFSGPVNWSVIFQGFGLRFHDLRFGPSFSGPAFSGPVNWSVIFQVLHFHLSGYSRGSLERIVKRQSDCRKRQFLVLSLAISSEALEVKATLLYSRPIIQSLVTFPLIPKYVTLSDRKRPFYVKFYFVLSTQVQNLLIYLYRKSKQLYRVAQKTSRTFAGVIQQCY